MNTYECSKCGMSVNANCGKCNEPLVNDMLKLDDGNEVQISKCPNDHGKIKSPLCCCLLYTSPSPRDVEESRMPSSA